MIPVHSLDLFVQPELVLELMNSPNPEDELDSHPLWSSLQFLSGLAGAVISLHVVETPEKTHENTGSLLQPADILQFLQTHLPGYPFKVADITSDVARTIEESTSDFAMLQPGILTEWKQNFRIPLWIPGRATPELESQCSLVMIDDFSEEASDMLYEGVEWARPSMTRLTLIHQADSDNPVPGDTCETETHQQIHDETESDEIDTDELIDSEPDLEESEEDYTPIREKLFERLWLTDFRTLDAGIEFVIDTKDYQTQWEVVDEREKIWVTMLTSDQLKSHFNFTSLQYESAGLLVFPST